MKYYKALKTENCTRRMETAGARNHDSDEGGVFSRQRKMASEIGQQVTLGQKTQIQSQNAREKENEKDEQNQREKGK
jgi:hypothetical protein